MLDFPRWKVWLVTLTLVVGVYYSIPSFLPESVTRQMPAWLAPQVDLGLDLAGGSQLLLEADLQDAAKQRLQSKEEEVVTELRRGTPRIEIGDYTYYDDPDVEYWALVNGVTMWDVGVERTVEVSGPDADRLVDFITCRDLTKCVVGQGKYMPVTAPDGGLVNDPVLLHVAENQWWLQLADSDAGLYALGLVATLVVALVLLRKISARSKSVWSAAG